MMMMYSYIVVAPRNWSGWWVWNVPSPLLLKS